MNKSKTMDRLKETDSVADRIARGMEIAVERCLLDKIVKGQTVVYAHPDGTVYSMSAKDALNHFLAETANENALSK